VAWLRAVSYRVLWKVGKWRSVGLVRPQVWGDVAALCETNVATELCDPEIHMSQFPTVSSVQVANVVDMSDRQSGRGCRCEQTSRAVGNRLRSQEECMGGRLVFDPHQALATPACRKLV